MSLVSVVIPTRDRPDLLAQAVRSVRAQRDVDLEILVVDDASSDPSATAPASVSDPRVRLLRHATPQGVAATRNRGVVEAAGAWVAFLDDDDLWAPDKLSAQLAAAELAGRSWVYAGAVRIDQHGTVLSGGPPPRPERITAALGRYNSVPAGASNVIVRAELLSRTGAFDPGLRRTEDWDLWLRLARHGPPAWVRRPLVGYRQHAANAPADPAAMVTEPALLARRYGIPVDHVAMLRRAAWTCLRAGRRGAALRYYARAVLAGDLRSVGRAGVALAHPAVGSEGLHRLLPSGPQREEWASEARAWLRELAAATSR